jgi:uncharacterized integral membrane protein
MRTFVVILVMLLAILLVIFGAQNTQLVNIRFLMIETPFVSLSLVIMVSAIAGALLVGLVGLWGNVRRGLRNRREGQNQSRLQARNAELESRITTLERENAELRMADQPSPAPAAPPSSAKSS